MRVINELGNDLKIIQDNKILRYTQDSVLLAEFVKIKTNDKKIVDFCSGTGVIGLLLLEKYPKLTVECLEINEQSIAIAKENAEINNLENRMMIHQIDVKSANEVINPNEVDLITCNPPYFKVDANSNINPEYNLAIARHEILITIEEIITVAKQLLKSKGKLVLSFRPERLSELVYKLESNNFTISRLQFVHQTVETSANTVLIEAVKSSPNLNTQILQPIIIEKEFNA